jgi:hypothetical protein
MDDLTPASAQRWRDAHCVGGLASRRMAVASRSKRRGGLRRHSDLSRGARSPVSVPIASGAMPSASATADPDDEPPGRAARQWSAGSPVCRNGDSAMPQWRGCAATAASRVAGRHQVV